jgi:hypothetical protein
VSAAWTVGRPEDSIRYGLVIAGYGALAVSGGVIAMERPGQISVFVLIAGLAAVTGVVGLIGVGIQDPPYGQRIGGSWQPAGTFEYAPTTALLQVAALPILLVAMAGARRAVAIAGAAGAAVAGAVLGLSDTTFAQVAGVAVLAIAVAAPRATVGRPRAVAVASVLLVLAAALIAHLLAGRFAPFCETGGDGERLAGLAALILAAPALWVLARRWLVGERGSAVAPAFTLVVAVAIGLGGALIDPQASCIAETEAIEPTAGDLHGRPDQWDAAVEVALDHPLGGAGGASFYFASVAYQEGTALYAHNLPLELWAELGPIGALLVLALYGAIAATLWQARGSRALWLAGPTVVAFALSNLVDFPWHLAGAGAIFALAVGVLIAAARYPPAASAAAEPSSNG